MTSFLRLTSHALPAMLIMATGALADTYRCEIDSRFTRGWIASSYLIDHTPGAKTLEVETFNKDGRRFSRITGRVTSNTARKLSGSFNWESVTTAQGREIDVRYIASLNKQNLKFTISAKVGNQGQKETGRGTCKKVS